MKSPRAQKARAVRHSYGEPLEREIRVQQRREAAIELSNTGSALERQTANGRDAARGRWRLGATPPTPSAASAGDQNTGPTTELARPLAASIAAAVAAAAGNGQELRWEYEVKMMM